MSISGICLSVGAFGYSFLGYFWTGLERGLGRAPYNLRAVSVSSSHKPIQYQPIQNRYCNTCFRSTKKRYCNPRQYQKELQIRAGVIR